MSALPVRGFRFLDDNEVSVFNFDDVDADGEHGFIREVDLLYSVPNDDCATKALHDLHNDYPLAPEHLLITENLLSPFCKSFNQKHFECKKLCPNLYDKIKYVTHIKNLKLYKRLGMTVTKIHRILTFVQSSWIKPYIELNTSLRQRACNQFERDLFKLMNNALFGKFLQRSRDQKNIDLISDATTFQKLIAKPQLESFKIINENTVLVDRLRATVLLDKPIQVGFCVLELSKTLMYEFHYDVMKRKYGSASKLLYTDTDSLCYFVQTPDIYQDMMSLKDKYLDTSDYPREHMLYSDKNKKVPGFMKDETNGVLIKSFCGLRSKMYSLLTTETKMSKLTAKGVKRGFVKKHVRHEMYLKTLKDRTCTYANFINFRSRSHKIETIKINRVCLSAYDDKRYVNNVDGVCTLAYGHYSIV